MGYQSRLFSYQCTALESNLGMRHFITFYHPFRQKIQLCQALLLLHINSMERLREKLTQLPEEFLTNWLKKNLQFAVDASSARLTEFGKVRSFLPYSQCFKWIVENREEPGVTHCGFLLCRSCSCTRRTVYLTFSLTVSPPTTSTFSFSANYYK